MESIQARDYTQGELPSDIFNSSSGDIKEWNGMPVQITVNNNGTRHVRPLSSSERAQRVAEQQRNAYMQAIQPAVQSLESSLPEISQRYQAARTQAEAEREPMKERYARLIDEIRGQGEGEKTQTIRTAAREYGRRGIPLSSTAYAEEEQARTSPITKYYLSKEAEATDAEQSANRELTNLITNLFGEETEAQRAVRQAIANIQAGAGTQAIDSANAIVEAALNRALQESQLKLQERQLSESARQTGISNDLEERKFQEAIRQFNEELAYKNKTGSSSSSSGYNSATKSALEQLQDLLGSNYVTPGSEKSTAWRYIHALEPTASSLGVNTSPLWAIYNAL
jgi:predicted GNAT family acetyltransferase